MTSTHMLRLIKPTNW